MSYLKQTFNGIVNGTLIGALLLALYSLFLFGGPEGIVELVFLIGNAAAYLFFGGIVFFVAVFILFSDDPETSWRQKHDLLCEKMLANRGINPDTEQGREFMECVRNQSDLAYLSHRRWKVGLDEAARETFETSLVAMRACGWLR